MAPEPKAAICATCRKVKATRHCERCYWLCCDVCGYWHVYERVRKPLGAVSWALKRTIDMRHYSGE